MKDWLGNEMQVGDTVLYTSNSTHVGMNKGELVTLEPGKIQVRIPVIKYRHFPGRAERYESTRVVTLLNGQGAYASVTKYYGPPEF